MNRRHVQVFPVGLAESDVVFDEFDSAGKLRAVGNAHIGCGDGGVIEAEGFYVRGVHGSIIAEGSERVKVDSAVLPAAV